MGAVKSTEFWADRPAPRMVASDVDGTLLGDDERISARTIEAIQRVRAAGVPFVLATGRPPRWIGMVAEQLGFGPLAVCANGAVIYDADADRVISARELPTDVLKWAGDLALSVLPGAGLAAERVGSSAHDSATPQFVSAPGYEHAWLNPDNIELSATDILSQPAVKLLIRKPGMESTVMRAALEPLVGDRVDVTFSTNNGLIEIAAHAVTKASGLSQVASQLGVASTEVVAFGDMPNDVPMLSWAGIGVAMRNANADAIAAADVVTESNNDDGLAQVLERWWPKQH